MVSFLNEIHQRYMKSSWEKMFDLIPDNSCVLDIGCGKGDLLFFLSGKIIKGIGLDKSYRKIGPALEKMHEFGANNLEFFLYDIRDSPLEIKTADVGIISGVLHTVDYSSQEKLFENSKKACKKIIVLDYDFNSLGNFLNNPFIHAEEFIAGHYSPFKNYLKQNILMEMSFVGSFKIPGKPLRLWEYI